MFYWGLLVGAVIGVNAGILFSAMLFIARMKEGRLRVPCRDYECRAADEQLFPSESSYLAVNAAGMSENPG